MVQKPPGVLPELTRMLERVARRLTGRRARILASQPDAVHSALSAVADAVITKTGEPVPVHVEHIEIVTIHPTGPGGDDLSLKDRGEGPERLSVSLPEQLAALPAGLTPREVGLLADRPTAVRSALKAAAASLVQDAPQSDAVAEAVGDARGRLVPVAEARRRMAERAGPGSPEALLSSDEIAMRLGLKTRQSVHDWMRKGRLLGWQGARRGYVFPAGQLDDRGRPLEGLQRIGGLFGDAYAAWVWMTTPKAALDDECPLALLAGGDVDRAVEIAEGDLQGDFA